MKRKKIKEEKIQIDYTVSLLRPEPCVYRSYGKLLSTWQFRKLGNSLTIEFRASLSITVCAKVWLKYRLRDQTHSSLANVSPPQ